MPEHALPRWGLGAANLGNLFSAMTDEEADALLSAAWESGIRHFDTAPHYGLGLSERRLGAFLRTRPREEFTVSTKVGRLLRPNPDWDGGLDDENDFAVPASLARVFDLSEAGVRASVEESLERTGLDRFDVLYLHDPERADGATSLGERLAAGVGALARMRDDGAVDEIGVGSMSTPALLAAARTPGVDLLMVAGRYTLAEQPALADVVPAARENGVGLVCASVFNSGLLSTAVPDRAARYEYGAVPEDVFRRVEAIARVCERFGVPLPAAALHYPLQDDAVRAVVVGASSAEQVAQNAGHMRRVVPPGLWTALRDDGLVP